MPPVMNVASSSVKPTSAPAPAASAKAVAPSVNPRTSTGGSAVGGAQASRNSLSAATNALVIDKSKKSRLVLKTTIAKSEFGIGLDLVKTADGGVAVQKLKDMPDGSPNPASVCSPPVLVGDLIVGVNDQACTQFTDVVKYIRGSNVKVCLWLERTEG
jgi:hypothetical protein